MQRTYQSFQTKIGGSFLHEELANINQTNVGWFSFFHNKGGKVFFFKNLGPT
jgi:hypothetical protein